MGQILSQGYMIIWTYVKTRKMQYNVYKMCAKADKIRYRINGVLLAHGSAVIEPVVVDLQETVSDMASTSLELAEAAADFPRYLSDALAAMSTRITICANNLRHTVERIHVFSDYHFYMKRIQED